MRLTMSGIFSDVFKKFVEPAPAFDRGNKINEAIEGQQKGEVHKGATHGQPTGPKKKKKKK
jgi:hypothetical protein